MNPPENPASDTIEALLRGAKTFREREYASADAPMLRLTDGQQPGALVIGCADSRVDPALIFGARPGDLLVVRVVANLVPPPGSDRLESGVMAAVELGLNALKIPHLIVCGHSGCAGVRTALDAAMLGTAPKDTCLHEWTSAAVPTCSEVIAEHGDASASYLCTHAEQRTVLQSLENLRAHTWLRDLESNGQLTLHGWWFEIPTGNLWIANPKTGEFQRS